MRRESTVTFEEVKSTFLRDNADLAHRNKWPLGALDVANRQFGRWERVVLAPDELLTVMLPHHSHFGVELVSVAGSSVSEAIEKLKSVDRSNNCYKQIRQFVGDRTSAIYLSAAPIRDEKYPDYNGLIKRGYRGLTHLDGLHRLIAWGQENRREVPAYIAGLA
jgi:hypothetical protein